MSRKEFGEASFDECDPPGFAPGRLPKTDTQSADDPALSDDHQFLLDKQVGVVRELKKEGRRTVALQTGLLSAFVAGLGLVRSQLSPGGFLQPDRLIELFGGMAGAVAVAAFFSVFLLVPRPLTRKAPLLARVLPIRLTREFRYPKTDDDAEACLHFNQEVIRRTEWRLQQLQRLNVLGVIAVFVWLIVQFVAFGG